MKLTLVGQVCHDFDVLLVFEQRATHHGVHDRRTIRPQTGFDEKINHGLNKFMRGFLKRQYQSWRQIRDIQQFGETYSVERVDAMEVLCKPCIEMKTEMCLPI